MIKEYKLEDINPVADIIEKVWRSVDVLRSYIRSTDYYVVLFILSLQKDGILSCLTKEKNHNKIKQDILKCIESSENDNKEGYQTIYRIFEPILKNLPADAIFHLFTLYNKLNQEKLKDHFSDIFDDLMYKISISQGRETGEFVQPIEISRFICALANIDENKKVYNPFAGLASFGVFLNGGQDYYGQEINLTTWALGALRIMAYERGGKSNYILGDSINNWLAEENEFDLIIANPPYGLRLPKNVMGNFGRIQNAEHFLIEKGIESINENGKVIVAISTGFLFRSGSEQSLRQYIVDNDLLEMVISLPGGLLYNTGIPIVVIVINKSKKLPGYVKFIDASNFVNENIERQKTLNDYRLNSIVHKDENSESQRLVENETIRSFDYNLNVPRYFLKDVYGSFLGDISTVIRGNRVKEDIEGKSVRIRDLKDDKIDIALNTENVELKELPGNIRQIDTTCILIAIRWRTFKPTLFEYSGTPIFITPDIVALKIDEEKVDAHYLINELHSEYVQEQAEAYRIGSAIPTIRREDLLNLKIQLPSLQEQKAKVAGIQELSDKIRNLQAERNALAHSKSVSRFNEFASLKHTLGRPRQNILDWADNLLDFFKNADSKEFKNINKSFNSFYGIDVVNALSQIKRDINFISELLEKGEKNGLEVEQHELNLISISELNKFLKQLSSNGYNFQIKKHFAEGEKLNIQAINTNLTLLQTMFDNILTNAHKHGFSKKQVSNEVLIEFKLVDDFLIMLIMNNGNPFPNNYDKEKFIAKYTTSNKQNGSGLGGYDINRIAVCLGDKEWDLKLNEDLIYPVKFKFQFPIKTLK